MLFSRYPGEIWFTVIFLEISWVANERVRRETPIFPEWYPGASLRGVIRSEAESPRLMMRPPLLGNRGIADFVVRKVAVAVL